MDLCYEDLEKLHQEEVARICEWLTEKVDGFSSKVKPEAKDVEEEVIPVCTTTACCSSWIWISLVSAWIALWVACLDDETVKRGPGA